jgi:hypothetical protein
MSKLVIAQDECKVGRSMRECQLCDPFKANNVLLCFSGSTRHQGNPFPPRTGEYKDEQPVNEAPQEVQAGGPKTQPLHSCVTANAVADVQLVVRIKMSLIALCTHTKDMPSPYGSRTYL